LQDPPEEQGDREVVEISILQALLGKGVYLQEALL
jgi:hypothetical protein